MGFSQQFRWMPGCLGVAALLTAVAGCSSNSAAPAGTAKTTPMASVTTAIIGAAGQEALAAYTGMWADMVSASHTANWKDAALPRHASGAALASLVQGLASEQHKGLVSKGAPTLHPQLTSITATDADIRDCAAGASWMEYVQATGQLANDTPGGNHLVNAHVTLRNGTWQVTKYSVGPVGSC